MPPKRKAHPDAASNVVKQPHKPKTPKMSAKDSATKTTSVKYKYCNASTLAPKPKYENLQWPNIDDFIDDKDQDMPKDGELLDGWIERVSDMGFPVSEDGGRLLQHLSSEAAKRDQEAHGVLIYNDWVGWGISEVMCNMLKDFNRDLYKKTVSPYKKWAYVEAFACFVAGEDWYMTNWLGNEDGEGIGTLVTMIGVMVLTCYDVLSEHDLLKPDSDVKNIPIISLMLIEFVEGNRPELECNWACEILRLCDEKGIELEKHVRKQVKVTAQKLKELRDEYLEKQEAGKHDQEEDGEVNGYVAFGRKEDWGPEDDVDGDGERMWFRWDWKPEYEEFKDEHKGGNHYDVTKKSKASLKKHRLG